MITQNEINRLYEWASNTSFPLRNERITSKYMGYGMMISHIKIGKKFKKYPNKQISKPVRDIVEKEDILGIYYVYYPPKMIAKPHVDYNPYQKDYLSLQRPRKIPNNNQNNECYIEWIGCGEKIYWKEGETMVFDVEKLHQGENNSDESMEFLYVDVERGVEIELWT